MSFNLQQTPVLQDFLDLVQIDAESFQERAMADALTMRLKALGCQVQEDDAGKATGGTAGNLIAILEGTLPGAILLSAHMDRVPNGQGIVPIVQGEQIRSSGNTILAADDLAGVCAILDGLRRLRQSGRPHCRIEIAFSIGEESYLVGAKHLDLLPFTAKECYVFDAGGRIGGIVYTAPSAANLCLEVFGKAAHAGSCPEAGKNAIIAAAKILSGIRDGRLDPESTSNFATFQAGSDHTNVVCDYACVQGETRSLTHEKLLNYLEYFHNYCRQNAPEGITVNTSAEILFHSYQIPANSVSIRHANKAFAQLGITPRLQQAGGGSDANVFNLQGLESIALACGMENAHTTDESLWIEDLIRLGELVEQLILTYPES